MANVTTLPLSIMVVDDHPLFRSALKSLIANIEFIENVDEAGNGIEALNLLNCKPYDFIFLDIEMPIMDGITATKEIVVKYPNTKVIIVSSYNSKRFVSELMNLGISGYIMKSTDSYEIRTALQQCMKGIPYFSSEIMNIWKDLCVSNAAFNKTRIHLSDKEIQILNLICQGKSNKEIAVFLKIEVVTVRTHRSHIMKKVGVNNVATLMNYAIENKYFKPLG